MFLTMRAAIESLRKRNPKQIIAAVPAASQAAFDMISSLADRVITCAIGTMPKFFIADFYRFWYDFSDREVIQCLKEWKHHRFETQPGPPGNGA